MLKPISGNDEIFETFEEVLDYLEDERSMLYGPNMIVGLTSGGYDPIHAGHISVLDDIVMQQLCDVLIVIVNSDRFLENKKGLAFQPQLLRCQIVQSLWTLSGTINRVLAFNPSDPNDPTVCEAIERIKPTYFFKGGDRTLDNLPEKAICDLLDVKIITGLGDDKQWSSSGLLNRYELKRLNSLARQRNDAMDKLDKIKEIMGL